jgi:hypothetical protein
MKNVVSAMKIVISNEKAAAQASNVATGVPTMIDQLAQLSTELSMTRRLSLDIGLRGRAI